MRRQDHSTDPFRRLVTRQDLVRDLLGLGVTADQTLLVHASVGSIGPVNGAADVVGALREVVGPRGNIVVPTMTMENSKTSQAHRKLIADLSDEEIAAFRREMPAFDKHATPSTSGALGEALRRVPGAIRSAHPQSSFAAIGPEAEYLMADHDLESHLGERSPLAKLYKMAASVLMLGVNYNVCSAFHLAEYRYAEPPPQAEYSCVVIENGQRTWLPYVDVVLNVGDFRKIGKSLKRHHGASVKKGNVGSASSRLIPLMLAVDHAEWWMKKYRALRPVALRGKSFYSCA